MAVPLLVAGRTIGAIGVRFTRAGAVEQECVRLLELLAAHMAPGLDLARQYRRAQAAHADLEAVLRLRDRVIAAASHDLRQPLGTVILRTDVLREELASGSLRAHELDASLAAIATSAAHMGRVLDELVEAARREMGHALPLDRSPMDLVALTREILAAQQALVPETHRVRLHAFQPALIGGWDAARVARIIQNLLGNARKYSPVGSAITVWVGREQDARGEWAVLRVRDEGIGIPTDDLPRVFEAFYRGRNAGEVPGTGLGLASAKDVVEQHGGHIAVHSTEGEGTIVTVKLPCQFSSEHPGPPRPRPLHAAAPRRTSTGPARFRPSA